jgi:hypothetical protein
LFLFDISLPSKGLFHLGRNLWCALIMMGILLINIWALGWLNIKVQVCNFIFLRCQAPLFVQHGGVSCW